MWHAIVGHDDVVERFRRALGRGRLASSFLFAGPAGIGKRTFALKLAQALLCSTRPEAEMDPCQQCPACVQVAAGTHPDLLLVAKPDDKSFLPLELLIGDKEHRGRQGLCHDLSLKPYMGGRKIAVIDDADFLNPEGANSLLKTLEEPPPRSVLILIGTSPARQLPTIRSRCQLVRFRPIAPDLLLGLIMAQGITDDQSEARRLAATSGGSLQQARQGADRELWAFRSRLYEWLTAPVLPSVPLAAAVLEFVDSAGKEAAVRRARARQVLQLAIEYYRRSLHAVPQSPTPAAQQPLPVETAAACLDRTLEAAEQIDRNVHQATLLECWADDLATITSG
jgi:DNA polymerase-3 subunit delta'